MKKLTALTILILSLNYVNAQMKTPNGEKPIVPAKNASISDHYGQWVTQSNSIIMWNKLTPVNIKKAMDTYKKLLRTNDVYRQYNDDSVWPATMTDKNDPHEMYTNIVIGYGELSWAVASGDYIYGLKANQDYIVIIATKAY